MDAKDKQLKMQEEKRLDEEAKERQAKERAEFLKSTAPPVKVSIPPKAPRNVTDVTWGDKREKIKTILQLKGMDSQQVEQAMASIDQIMWGS